MNKRMYGFQENHAALYRLLEGEDVPGYEGRKGVMDMIQDVLVACYYLGVNPLRELRQVFPQYDWRYHLLESERMAREVVARSDFIWLVQGIPPDDDMTEVVTATRHNLTDAPRRLFFAADGWKSMTKGAVNAYISSLGGVPVWYPD